MLARVFFYVQLVAKNILKFCLRGMLKDRQRLTLFQFLDALRKILSEKIKEEDMQQLEMEVNEALALMERDFPVDIQVCQILFHLIIISHCMHANSFKLFSIQVIIIHLIRHIVDGMKQFGPVYATWMYGYERFNSWLHRRVTNRRYPEATLMETYRVCYSCEQTCMDELIIYNPYCRQSR